MSESPTSARAFSRVIGRLLFMPITVLRDIIWPGESRKDPVPEESASAPATTDGTKSPLPPDYRGQYVEARRTLLQTARLACVLFGVLLVLTLEQTPIVVADYQLEDQFSGQVRSLVLVEGHVDRLDQVVADGLKAWEQRVVEQVERALGKVIALDAYNDALAGSGSTSGTKPDAPAFLTNCRNDDSDVNVWVYDRDAVREHWRDLVTRCIIEPMDADFHSDAQVQLMAHVNDARRAISTTIALARQEFALSQESNSGASLASSAPPTEISTEQQVQTELNNIETRVGTVVHIVETGAIAAVQPSPRNWLTQFAGADGTLRSFRDNLMLAYASPFGTKLVAPPRSAGSSNRGVNVAARDPLLTSTMSFTVSLTSTAQQLQKQVSSVLERQQVLQEDQAQRLAQIQPAVPGVYQPLLVVARPKYLVLGYPLALAIVSAYLLLSYTTMRWRAGTYGVGDSTVVTALIFLGLALTPLAVLIYLFQPYDWPQFTDSWWQWMHRGPLIGLSVIILACMIALLRSDTARKSTRSA